MNAVLLSALKSGFYFHPSDKDPSLGTPEGKSHLRVSFRFTVIPKML
jgi:hypothetical protein